MTVSSLWIDATLRPCDQIPSKANKSVSTPRTKADAHRTGVWQGLQ